MPITLLNVRDFDGMHMADAHKNGFIAKLNTLIGRANAGGYAALVGGDITASDLTAAALTQVFVFPAPSLTNPYIVRASYFDLGTRFDGAGTVSDIIIGTAGTDNGFATTLSLRGSLGYTVGPAGALVDTIVAAGTPIQVTIGSDANVDTLTAGFFNSIGLDIAVLP